MQKINPLLIIAICAGAAAGALDLNWFAGLGWNVGSGAAKEGIEFVESSRNAPTPQLPVGDQQ